MKRFSYFLFAFLFAIACHGTEREEEIGRIVEPFMQWKPGCALMVGVMDGGGSLLLGYGRLSKDDASPPDKNTEYEIGSISKTFTAILLSDMVLRGDVKLNDPIADYLPEQAAMKSWEARAVTLHDLIRHTSGLPRLADNMPWSDPGDPYADYTIGLLYDFLNHVRPEFKPGTKSVYSNLGVGLLGHILAREAGMSYEALMRRRIAQPLDMDDTAIELNSEQKRRLVGGTNSEGDSVKNWGFTDAYAGAGGIRSTAADMMKYLAANMVLNETPLTPAIRYSHESHCPAGEEVDDNLKLAWYEVPIASDELKVLFHNGQTGGYHSFIGFNVKEGIGVVALVNCAVMELDRVGFALLELLAGFDPVPPKFGD
ncbi:MAG: serine hydrolase [bacterium]|nr:serine hydrolase [bacterium]